MMASPKAEPRCWNIPGGPLRGGVLGALLGIMLSGLPPAAQGQIGERKPEAGDLSSHSLPGLGAPDARRVQVEWNRFYDHAGLATILTRLQEAFPELTRLYSLGKSTEGRDLWCLEVTARNVGTSERKPGMYIDGNIHGNEVQGSEAIAYTAWYLCHQYGRVAKVDDLLDHCVFYLVPTINPDGRQRWLHTAQTPHSMRSGTLPIDNDRDGKADEDDTDDLDGDGSITQMRIKDPNGRWKLHQQFPEWLMVEAPEDQMGGYTLLGSEGIDNDGDGRINEDPVGGYDMNRNWAWDWQPNFIQGGAHDYPFSFPETRAVAEFVVAHTNIAAFQTYHNFGGMILRSPGRDGGVTRSSDDQVLQFIAQRGEKMLPFYRSMIVWKDLYTVWGGEFDWFYGARGILGFTTEMWSLRNLDKGGGQPSREDEAAFMRYVLLNEGLTPWKEFDHPLYGKIEIGGAKKHWGRTPPSFFLEEECHRNMAFTLYYADQMPRLFLSGVEITRIDDNLFKIWVTIENTRLIPTRSDQDRRNHITRPDVVTLQGPGVKVISAGIVTDRYLKRVQAVKRRPERVELETIGGMDAVRVQFIVAGQGGFTVGVDSAKGGVVTADSKLP